MRMYFECTEEETKAAISALMHIFDRCDERNARQDRQEIDRLHHEVDRLREELRHYRPDHH